MNRQNNAGSFSAPWGRATRWISVLMVLGMLGVASIPFAASNLPPLARIALFTAPVLIIVVTLPFMVLGYKVEKDVLVVKRPGWTTRIQLNGLRSAEINPQAMNRSIRVFGNGGVFAFNGLFWSKALGRYRAYVTDLKRVVVLTLADRIVMISPDAPDDFLAQLRAQRLLR